MHSTLPGVTRKVLGTFMFAQVARRDHLSRRPGTEDPSI